MFKADFFNIFSHLKYSSDPVEEGNFSEEKSVPSHMVQFSEEEKVLLKRVVLAHSFFLITTVYFICICTQKSGEKKYKYGFHKNGLL